MLDSSDVSFLYAIGPDRLDAVELLAPGARDRLVVGLLVVVIHHQFRPPPSAIHSSISGFRNRQLVPNLKPGISRRWASLWTVL